MEEDDDDEVVAPAANQIIIGLYCKFHSAGGRILSQLCVHCISMYCVMSLLAGGVVFMESYIQVVVSSLSSSALEICLNTTYTPSGLC